jgi:hypothetical protein
MDAKKLPERPRLERYRRLAKDLLAARRSEDRSTRFTLSDARLQIARSYGFESWAKFQKHIEAAARKSSAVAQFESAADAVIRRHGRAGTPAAPQPGVGSRPLHARPSGHPAALRCRQRRRSSHAPARCRRRSRRVRATALDLVASSIHPERAGVEIALMETLLGADASIDGLPGGSNPLNTALSNGRGARLDTEGAAGVGRVDVLRSLIDGATAAQTNAGFMWACEYGRTNAVEFLLDRGLDVPTTGPPHGQTGLHWAAYGGHVDIVKLLLDRRDTRGLGAPRPRRSARGPARSPSRGRRAAAGRRRRAPYAPNCANVRKWPAGSLTPNSLAP